MVALTESKFGMPSPGWVSPLEPSASMVKTLRGTKVGWGSVGRSGLGR